MKPKIVITKVILPLWVLGCCSNCMARVTPVTPAPTISDSQTPTAAPPSPTIQTTQQSPTPSPTRLPATVTVTPVPSTATPPSISHLDIELASSIGGAATALQIHGSYTYVGVGAELVILEINNEANLTPVGRTKLPATALDIAVSDSYAYVATDRGVWVVDVGDRTMPHVASEYAIPAGATSLVVSQERLYVGTAGAGVWALDINDPATLSTATVFEIEG